MIWLLSQRSLSPSNWTIVFFQGISEKLSIPLILKTISEQSLPHLRSVQSNPHSEDVKGTQSWYWWSFRTQFQDIPWKHRNMQPVVVLCVSTDVIRWRSIKIYPCRYGLDHQKQEDLMVRLILISKKPYDPMIRIIREAIEIKPRVSIRKTAIQYQEPGYWYFLRNYPKASLYHP